jgi:hypothetical protein
MAVYAALNDAVFDRMARLSGGRDCGNLEETCRSFAAPCRICGALRPKLPGTTGQSNVIRSAKPGRKKAVNSGSECVMRQLFALSVLVVANVLLILPFGIVPIGSASAADECLAKPNAPASAGTHWYFRTDRAAKRKCWFLGEVGHKARTNAEQVASPANAPAKPPKARASAGGEEPKASTVERNAQTTGFTPSSFEPAAVEAAGKGSRQTTALAGDADQPGSLERYQPVIKVANSTELSKVDEGDDLPLVWPPLAPAERAEPAAAQPAAAQPVAAGPVAAKPAAAAQASASSMTLAIIFVLIASGLTAAFFAARAVLGYIKGLRLDRPLARPADWSPTSMPQVAASTFGREPRRADTGRAQRVLRNPLRELEEPLRRLAETSGARPRQSA